MEHLFERLKKYAAEDVYPYHMPGHKRRPWGELPEELYEADITEIEGFDNLHQPEEILLELQEKAARLYGAEESFYLINGSTSGILCAVSSALPKDGHILMARNCHKSAYHGAYLRNLRLSFLWPSYLDEYGIYDAVTPKQVCMALEKEPDIQAVLIVSPTYEGRIADVEAIAEIVHQKNIPLIVDEAHGAHLGLADGFAPNSCQLGADLVIHSVHKTLPSLTQTALLHVKGKQIDRLLLRRFLRIYQSSSPSYLLMAAIDNALQYVEVQGQEAFRHFRNRYGEMVKRLCTGCSRLSFPDAECHIRWDAKEKTKLSEGTGQDVGKLLISVRGSGLTGKQLYDLLLKEYHLQLEMAAEGYALAMFTVNDGEEAYRRMTEALLAIDSQMAAKAEKTNICFDMDTVRRNKLGEDFAGKDGKDKKGKHMHGLPQEIIPLSAAWDMPAEKTLLEDSVGRCAGEFINLYPPGIPLLVPGEKVTEDLCFCIRNALEQGLTVQGIEIDKKNKLLKKNIYMRVIK